MTGTKKKSNFGKNGIVPPLSQEEMAGSQKQQQETEVFLNPSDVQ